MGANHKNNMRSILLLIAFAVPAMAATVSKAAYTADTNCATITGDLQYQFDTGVCSCDGEFEPAACTKWVKYSTTGTTSISKVEYTDAECTTTSGTPFTTLRFLRQFSWTYRYQVEDRLHHTNSQ